MQHCLMLDLKDDPASIEEYERYHQRIWPEVEAHLKRQGILSMRIYRLGTRLCMVMETDDTAFDADAMAREQSTLPSLQQWETLMWQYQRPTPWTPAGQKWTAANCIFDLNETSSAAQQTPSE